MYKSQLRHLTTSIPPSGMHLLPSQDVRVTNTPPLLGLRFSVFTHPSCWIQVLFVFLCCPHNPHAGEKNKPSRVQTMEVCVPYSVTFFFVPTITNIYYFFILFGDYFLKPLSSFLVNV